MSFARYAKATTDACRPWLMLLAVGRRWCDVAHLMRTSHGWCANAVASAICRWSMSHFLYAQNTNDVTWWMRAGHDQSRQADAHTPRLMREGLGLSCKSLADVACQMRTCHVRCVQDLANAAFLWPTTTGRCRSSRPILPRRCAHATSDACMPWLMPPAVGRRRCRPADGTRHEWCVHALAYAACRWSMSPFNARRPWTKSLGGCTLATGDVAYPMRTLPGWCVQTLDDVVCRWPTSLARCAYATSNACRPWLIPPAVSRRSLPDSHMPRPMRGPVRVLDSEARILN